MKTKLTAAFSMPFREPFSTRLWMNYYGSQLGPDNLYVLMAEHEDPTFAELRRLWPSANFIPHREPTVFPAGEDMETWRLGTVHAWQERLLETYEVVIFSDPDEYLIPHQGSLLDFSRLMIGAGYERARALGYNVIQQPDTEADVERVPGADVLKDRHVMFAHGTYDKTLIVRKPQKYSPGFHSVYDGPTRRNDERHREISLAHCQLLDIPAWMEQCAPRWEPEANEACGRPNFGRKIERPDVEEFFRKRAAFWTGGKPMGNEPPVAIPANWYGKVIY